MSLKLFGGNSYTTVFAVLFTLFALAKCAPAQSESELEDRIVNRAKKLGDMLIFPNKEQAAGILNLEEDKIDFASKDENDSVKKFPTKSKTKFLEDSGPKYESHGIQKSSGVNQNILFQGDKETELIAPQNNEESIPEKRNIDNNDESKKTILESKATVFSYDNFDGASRHFKVSEKCLTLPGDWHNRISSVNTHETCVEICQYKNCGGRCIRVAPGTLGHNRLRAINFDKRIVSIRAC